MKKLLALLLLSIGAFAQTNIRANNGTFTGAVTALSVGGYRYALSDGWVCDGATDDTAAFTASLAAISNAGGGVLVLPLNKTCRIAGQITIPNDGASPPHQQSIKIQGGIGGGLEQGYTFSCNGGTILDMRFNSATAKIDTRGFGKLEVTGICFTDSNTDGSAFVFTTNTNIQFHDNQFRGNPAAVNDIFILGGTNACCVVDGTSGSIFQGYGSNIHHNQVDYCKRFVLLQNEANAVHVNNNDVFANCANSTGGAIELNPGANPATQLIAGSDIGFNLIEMVGYKYGIYLVQNSAGNQIISNECFDTGASSLNCVKIATGVANNGNQVIDADATGVLPPSVDVLNSSQSLGIFQGATGSATKPTYSWSGFGSNPPGFYRIGSAIGVAGSGLATHNFNFNVAGQFQTRSDGEYCFSSTTDPGSGLGDTGYSRGGAGIHMFGTCIPGDFSGTIKTTFVNAVTGFLVNGLATSGRFLKCDGTKCAFSTGSASGIGTPTVCTNQAVTGFTLNSDAAPTSTCSTITSAFTSGTFSPTAHNLLSASHGDTTAASAVRGDGLFALGASPTWQRVAHPATTGGYFKWNATDMVASTGAAAGTGSCTNQVVTAENADASPTCTTVTSSYVDTSIAKTGTDINTSNQVTQVSTTLGNYNGSATAGLGAAIPRGYARQVGQTASVALTTINTSIGADAMYLLVSEFDCDTSVAGATVTPTFSWTDTSNTVISVSGATATCTTLGLGSNAFNTFGFIAKASTAIKYSVAITGSPNYDGRISVMQLGTN